MRIIVGIIMRVTRIAREIVRIILSIERNSEINEKYVINSEDSSKKNSENNKEDYENYET